MARQQESRKTTKFTADRTHSLAGFWRPSKDGDTIEGVIDDVVPTDNQPYLVLKVTEAVDVVARDRDSGDEYDGEAEKGEEVGLTLWAKLRGLDRRVGHWVKIVYEGEEKGPKGTTVKLFDVDISERPEGKAKASNGSSNGRGAAKKGGAKKGGKGSRRAAKSEESDGDDIPF